MWGAVIQEVLRCGVRCGWNIGLSVKRTGVRILLLPFQSLGNFVDATLLPFT